MINSWHKRYFFAIKKCLDYSKLWLRACSEIYYLLQDSGIRLFFWFSNCGSQEIANALKSSK